MIQEYEQMKESETQFEIYHHKMASLYFGFGAIESFLNAEIRIVFTREGVDDKTIFQTYSRQVMKNDGINGLNIWWYNRKKSF